MMHESVLNFLATAVRPEEVRGFSVLEVGSANVNGSPREVLMPHEPGRYVGVDSAPGEDVDVVVDASALTLIFGRGSFDVVVSTEMLEHAKDWRDAVVQMKNVLRVGGLLIVTTRSPGFPYHGFPDDFNRFTLKDFAAIFADMDIESLIDDPDPESPGVFFKARKTNATGRVDPWFINVAQIERPKL